MRLITFILVLCLALLAFYIGFNVGLSQQSEIKVVEVPTPEETEPAAPIPEPEPTVEAPAPTTDTEQIPDSTPDTDPSTEKGSEPLPTAAEMAARAAEPVVDLTDTQGRTIAVEITEVGEDHIKARRKLDFRVVQIPIDMLSEVDQAFITYLSEQRAEPGSDVVSPAMEEAPQELLERIFGND